jgi:hypothetical protein
MASSAYETSVAYGRTVARVLTEKYIYAGLGDSLFDITMVRISESSLSELLANAFVSGQLDALTRLQGGAR